ncbi:sigma factor-like helix-turn-helix DNA-binding protein [Sphingomonas elodea]|nr:sigma factor-like helix-turn-helix DNA-binding protein [Sphingomonas elodea]
MEAALAELPEGVQRSFRLHKLEGLSHAEVAAQMGVSKA